MIERRAGCSPRLDSKKRLAIRNPLRHGDHAKDRDRALDLGAAADLSGHVAQAAGAFRRFLLAGGDLNAPRLRSLRARIDALATHGQDEP